MDPTPGLHLPGNGGRRLNLHAQVVRELGLRILAGGLRPGHVLPNEADLGRELGVSRSILREAIKSLAAKGLVASRTRVGTHVRDPQHWNLLDLDVLSWRYATMPRMAFFRDLFEVRRVVEPGAAELASETAEPSDLAALDQACAAMEQAEPTSDAAIAADVAFHQAILTACHSDLLLQFGTLIGVGLETSFRISTRFYPVSLPHHRPVLHAIHRRNPAKARAAMQTLLSETFADIERQLRELPDRSFTQP
jgi:GntR family transcriptional regulator, galactonate operon transcriptional repressor